MTALREAVATFCDPDAWTLRETLRGDAQLEERIADSLTRADQILAAVFGAIREPTLDSIAATIKGQWMVAWSYGGMGNWEATAWATTGSNFEEKYWAIAETPEQALKTAAAAAERGGG